MASTYKQLLPTDVASTKTLLHEAIPITGTIVSGTYGGNNVKTYSHGMFQSYYDYPYLSSSANHIFDISEGYSSVSSLVNTSNSQNSKKKNVYNQLAQLGFGYDKNGTIERFDEDGDIAAGGTKINEAFFFTFSRLLIKDEIKKGSFALTLGVSSSYANAHLQQIAITDKDGTSGYKVNSPVGEYGILYASNSVGTPIHSSKLTGGYAKCGLIYYQAGIAVLTASVFMSASSGFGVNVECDMDAAGKSFKQLLTGSVINDGGTAIAHRINNLSFNNTTELNSTIYFCRINHNEYNYSSNPTYVSGSEIRVKGGVQSNNPVSYISTVGLYSSDNQLMAVGKLSEPLRKDPTIEYTLRARLDY
jgi:hypothetical protein